MLQNWGSMRKILSSFLCVFSLAVFAFGQDYDSHDGQDHSEQTEHSEDHGHDSLCPVSLKLITMEPVSMLTTIT